MEKNDIWGLVFMMLDLVGKSRPNRLSARMHRHSGWELIYNVDGTGTMTVGERGYGFEPGTVVLCPPGVYHGKQAEQGFSDYFVRFSEAELVRQVFVWKDTYDRRLLKLLQVLHGIWYENGASPACSSLADAVLALIGPMLAGRVQNEHVRRLRNAIAEGYTDPDFSIKEAMRDMPVSTDHLRRLFVQELEQTPHEYLAQLRLEKAKRLLSDEHCSVSEAAYRCGFYDALYFSKVFRKATGVVPSRWV